MNMKPRPLTFIIVKLAMPIALLAWLVWVIWMLIWVFTSAGPQPECLSMGTLEEARAGLELCCWEVGC